MDPIRLVGAAWLALTVAGVAPAQQPAVPVVMKRLDMGISVDYAHRTLDGAAVLELRNVTAAGISMLPLQVGRLMEITSVKGADGNPLKFTQDVVRFSDWPTRQMNQAWI